MRCPQAHTDARARDCACDAGGGVGAPDDRGARLRTRRRPLAVRGLRLRPPGARRLPPDRRALLPRHRPAQGERSTGPRAARLGPRSVGFSGHGRARCCIRPGRRYSLAAEARRVVLRDRAGDRITACGPLGKAGAGVRIGASGAIAAASSPATPAAAGDQRAGGPGLRQGRARERGALLVARAGTARPGGRRVPPTGWRQARRRVRSPCRHTRSQVYGGRAAETKATNRAVAATANRVVTYRGKPAVTTTSRPPAGEPRARSSASRRGRGSRTRSVNDPRRRLARAPMDRAALRRADGIRAHGPVRGQALERIEVLERGDSPRIVRARGRLRRQHGDQRRHAAREIELRSTWARFVHR